MLLYNPWVKEEDWRETRKYFELDQNENITYQYLRDAAKIMFKGQFIAIKCYIKNNCSIKIEDAP